jgi:ABC-type dipeptide/oligopeptide/nickel transport system ATPase component
MRFWATRSRSVVGSSATRKGRIVEAGPAARLFAAPAAPATRALLAAHRALHGERGGRRRRGRG